MKTFNEMILDVRKRVRRKEIGNKGTVPFRDKSKYKRNQKHKKKNEAGEGPPFLFSKFYLFN